MCIIEGQEYLHHTPLLRLALFIFFRLIKLKEIEETCIAGKWRGSKPPNAANTRQGKTRVISILFIYFSSPFFPSVPPFLAAYLDFNPPSPPPPSAAPSSPAAAAANPHANTARGNTTALLSGRLSSG